jgi:hypothetical protein
MFLLVLRRRDPDNTLELAVEMREIIEADIVTNLADTHIVFNQVFAGMTHLYFI